MPAAKTPRFWLGTILAAIAALETPTARANPDIYDRAMQSTGWLINPREKSSALGTCWVIDREQKLLISSAHLVGDSREVLVYFPQVVDGRFANDASFYLMKASALNGQVVVVDTVRDLALIKLGSLPNGIKELKLADASPRPGDNVHSVGNSGLGKGTSGMLWRYTRGNVRQVYDRKVKVEDRVEKVRLVETQSPVNTGDSGGAILNERAEVVGVAMAYDPNERLVSQNVDVSEIKTFLKNSTAELARTKDQLGQAKLPSFSPVGTWKMFAKTDDGSKTQGQAFFKNDGTYVLSDQADAEESQAGRFAYANGILLLIADDGQAAFKLIWTNRDQFSTARNGVELSFQK